MAEVQVGGVRFHVQRLGTGPRLVVFLHGLVMDNLSSWYFTLANPVAGFAEVLLYDLRGHGWSERPATGYALPQMVADLAGILDALRLGSRPATLVGNSYGALVALAFAVARPAQVEALVLVDGHLSDESWAASMQKTLRLAGPERDQLILQAFRHWLGRHSARKRNRLAVNAQALVEKTSLVEDIGKTPDYGPQLGGVRCPVLAIYGEESDILVHGQRLAAGLPSCDLRVYPGCSHSVIWEATERLQRDVTEWLRGAG
jgi:pimeloyl-ACP methyl ester carboxylesterase